MAKGIQDTLKLGPIPPPTSGCFGVGENEVKAVDDGALVGQVCPGRGRLLRANELQKTNTRKGDLEIGFGGAAGIVGRGELPRDALAVEALAEPIGVTGLAAVTATRTRMGKGHRKADSSVASALRTYVLIIED
jgi:hypothetical protein